MSGVGTRGTGTAHRQRVAAYYDATQVLYSTLWSGSAVHYGLWDHDTRGHRQAIRNLDRLVAAELALSPGSRVLDAGCGIGGTSCYLAERHGLEVVGITLSRVQARHAGRRAARGGAAIRPRVLIADYLRTGFADAVFDGVIAIESSCHAERKPDFLAEAFRVLRAGGRLVVLDGFRARPTAESDRYRELLAGMALPDLAPAGEFARQARRAGFVLQHDLDLTPRILPSAHRIAKLSAIGVCVCRMLRLPRAWLAHGRAGLAQLPLFAEGFLVYRAFVATKPEAMPLPDRPIRTPRPGRPRDEPRAPDGDASP